MQYTSSYTSHATPSSASADSSSAHATTTKQNAPYMSPALALQPEMLGQQQQQSTSNAGHTAQYSAYAYQQAQLAQGIHTPTTSSHASGYEGSYGQVNVGYGHQASHPSSPAWVTTRTGSFGHMNANNNMMNSQGSVVSNGSMTQEAATTRVEGKKYRHNPYASSEASTPPASPLMGSATQSNGFYTPPDATGYGAAPLDPAAPIYDYSVMNGAADNLMLGGGGMSNMNGSTSSHSLNMPVANNLEDQFNSIVGNIAQTACSARGRTLLLNIIRMQHLDKIQVIFEELCHSFTLVISDPQGCHVLRFIVEYLQESHIDMLCSIMTPELAYEMCTLSQHSRRVLQCLVEHHKTTRLQPLIEVICANGQAIAIAKTQQGCIAIMRILENVVAPLKDMVFQAIAPAFPQLAIDQFGNYTVQTAIQTVERTILSATIGEVLYGQFVNVSCNKFGSNVMEKVVQAATPALMHGLLQELCYEPSNLHKLINDGFGNFVIQAMIEATAGSAEGRRLCETVRPLLQSSPYGHKIEAKLRNKRLLGNVSSDSTNRSNSTQTGASTSSSNCGDR